MRERAPSDADEDGKFEPRFGQGEVAPGVDGWGRLPRVSFRRLEYREPRQRQVHMRTVIARRVLASDPVDLQQLERQLRERLDALGPAPRAELLRVLMLPDFDRADRIGEFWGYPESRAFAGLLIDCEEDRTLRAVLVGMVREFDRPR
jgi:hypothetical protein